MNINELVNQLVQRRNQSEGSIGGSKSIDDLLQASDLAQFLSSSAIDATRAVGPDNVVPENINPGMTGEQLNTVVGDPQQPTIGQPVPDNIGTMTPEMLEMIIKEMGKRPR